MFSFLSEEGFFGSRFLRWNACLWSPMTITMKIYDPAWIFTFSSIWKDDCLTWIPILILQKVYPARKEAGVPWRLGFLILSSVSKHGLGMSFFVAVCCKNKKSYVSLNIQSCGKIVIRVQAIEWLWFGKSTRFEQCSLTSCGGCVFLGCATLDT